MENRIENVINGALELNAKINEKISAIDNCEVFIKKLDEGNLSLLMPEGEILSLEPAITAEQVESVMQGIRALARQNVENAVSFLEKVSGQEPELPFVTVPQEIVPESEYEPVLTPETEPTPEFPEECATPGQTVIPARVKKPPVRTSKMAVAEVEQMFRDGYSVEDIAKHYGYKTTATVQKFIEKNRIKVKVLTQGNDKARELTEEDIPAIRAMYTDGPMTLTDTAADLGTTKKKLREFCEKHHLLKVKKDW